MSERIPLAGSYGLLLKNYDFQSFQTHPMSWFQVTPTTLLLKPWYNPNPAGAPDKSDIWELSETKSSEAQKKENNNLTLSAPALQSYVICHSCVRQKFHFSKMLFLPWLTIVLHRITKENLHFSPKKARVHYNLALNMCYPLFTSRSKFNCPENTNGGEFKKKYLYFVALFLR